MITIPKAILLGIIQGLTEFLPVSSSGHLVLFQHLLGMNEPMVVFDIVVHWGTLLAVLIYFSKDIFQMIRQSILFLWYWPRVRNLDTLFHQYPYAMVAFFVILSTLSTALLAFGFKDAIEYFFESVPAVGIAWILMGILLLGSRRFQSGDRGLDMLNNRDAFFIGATQGISFIPGISRSGSTILMGLALGLKKEEAARFSFWIAIPAIVGAGILKMEEGIQFANSHGGPLLAGFIASAITGFLLRIARA